MSKDDSSLNFGLGILLGVLGGIAAGILYSPKAGSEMREELKLVIDEFKEKVAPEIKEATKQAKNLIEQSKIRIERECQKINENQKAKKLARAKNKEQDIYCL